MAETPHLRPARAALLAGALAFVFLAGMMNLVTRGWPAWYRLARTGATAAATVTAVVPGSHTTCYFEFTAGSRKHTSFDNGCDAHRGDVGTVTYDPSNPSLATLKSPRQELGLQVLVCVALSLVAGAVAGRQGAG